jgi:hypothetical protein
MQNQYRRHHPPAFNPSERGLTLEPYNPWQEIPFALLVPLTYFLWLAGFLQ